MVLFLSCRQSEHASKLRELALKQFRSHANAPTTERLKSRGAWNGAKPGPTTKVKNSHAKGDTVMEVRNVMEHYEIYKDGKFVCSCDASELSEVVEEMRE